MKTSNIELLKKLSIMLKESCHAPGCQKYRNCPRQCGCNKRRTFKLNTETAMCWEISDILWGMFRRYKPTITDRRKVVAAVYAYNNLTRFHMTKGWQNFFNSIAECIEENCFPTKRYFKVWVTNIHYIDNLKTRLNRLKRYPRK